MVKYFNSWPPPLNTYKKRCTNLFHRFFYFFFLNFFSTIYHSSPPFSVFFTKLPLYNHEPSVLSKFFTLYTKTTFLGSVLM